MIPILYEDAAIVVCVKPVGLCAEETELPADSLPLTLVGEGHGKTLYTVHRLDRAVSGVMVYAKTKDCAAALSTAIQADNFHKEYLAVLHGVPPESEEMLTDELYRDAHTQKAYVAKKPRRGTKTARLSYRVLETAEDAGEPLSLVRVNLYTGRFHQIRVQFASRGLPIVGDGKYGSRRNRCDIALFCAMLTISHPKTKKQMTFTASPAQAAPWTAFQSHNLKGMNTNAN